MMKRRKEQNSTGAQEHKRTSRLFFSCALTFFCSCSLVTSNIFAEASVESSGSAVSPTTIEPPADETEFLPIQAAFRDGLADVVRDRAKEFILKYPESKHRDEASFFLGKAYLMLRNYPEAIRFLEPLAQGVPQGSMQEEAAYWAAEAYFKAKDFPSAIRYYSKVIEKFPTSRYMVYALYSRGWAFYEMRDYEEATAEFEFISENYTADPLAVEAAYKLAQCYSEQKKFDLAIPALQRFTQEFPLSPKAPNAYYLLGECYYEQGEYAIALEAFKRCYELGPSPNLRLSAKSGLGWAYFQLGKYAEALESFTISPDEARENFLTGSFFYGKARALAMLGRFSEAIAAYEESIRSSSGVESDTLDELLFWKAEAHYNAEEYQKAVDLYEEILKKFPKTDFFDQIHYNLGWAFTRLKRFEEAQRHFQIVAGEGSSEALRAGALCRLGDTHLEKSEFEKSLEVYDLVLKNYPQSMYADYAQYQLGSVLDRLDRPEAAILSFQSLLVNYPKSHYQDEAIYKLGSILMKKGSFPEAIAQFDKLISLFPESHLADKARFQAGNCYFNQGKYEEALASFRDAAKHSPDSQVGRLAKYQVGWSLFRSGKEDQAIKEFADYLSRYPESDIAPDVEFGLGDYYFNKGQYEKARAHYQRVVDRFPASAVSSKARYGLAMTFEREGDLWASIRELKTLFDAYPNSELAARGLLKTAEFLVSQGKSSEAKAEFLKIIQESSVQPYQMMAQKKLAQILKNEGHLRESAIYFSEALKAAQGDLACEIHFELADVYEVGGDLERAANEFLKLSELYPNNMIYADKSRIRSAKLFENLERWDQALAVYERIASSTSNQAGFAMEKVKKIKKKKRGIN